ncbi:MAG: helix-turn-helix domain-containing protein [Solirubrobacterales bacterium]
MGQRLRTAREQRGLSLREVARRLGISASALSQIETGKSRPSVKTLYAIVSELGLSMDQLLAGPADKSGSLIVQRAESRPSLSLDSGVTWDRLTAAQDPNVDILYFTYEPGGSSSGSDELVRRNGREYGVVISGELELSVGLEKIILGPGDSCSFDSDEPHRLANPGDEPTTAIWFVAGRR